MRGQIRSWLKKLFVGAMMTMGAMGETTLFGDEGMWLYTNPPIERIKARYNFEPSKDWLEYVKQ